MGLAGLACLLMGSAVSAVVNLGDLGGVSGSYGVSPATEKDIYTSSVATL